MFTHQLAEQGIQQMKQTMTKLLNSMFPYKGTRHTLRLIKLDVGSNPAIYNYDRQKELKLKGRSLSVPLIAELELVNNETGKVIDRERLTLMQLPVITPRGSFLVDGNEYQTMNQLRLRSGTYTRETQAGELETQVNTETGYNFKVRLNPKTDIFTLQTSKSNIPLYPFLRGMGITDSAIARYIGHEMMEKNRHAHGHKVREAIEKFAKAFRLKVETKDEEGYRKAVLEFFRLTRMDPDTTKLTLGKPFSTVTPEMILMSAQKLLKVNLGETKPDDRDSLEFKKFLTVNDHLAERIEKKKPDIERRIKNNIDRHQRVRDIIATSDFSRPIKSFFTSSTLASTTDQTNPLSMLGEYTKVTIMGEGGVQDQNVITPDMININPSTLGFLDPVHTPESGKIGATLHLTQQATQMGDSLATKVINAKTGKLETVRPIDMVQAVVAFPDQYDPKTKKFKSNKVKVMNKKEMDVVHPSKVDYIIVSPKSIFDTTTNLIPFLANDQGNRAMMAGKMQEQALSLKYREAPLVQSGVRGNETFEKVIGRTNTLTAPVDGEITSLKPLKIKDSRGRVIEVPMYNNFPLAGGAYVTHELRPHVRVGLKVKTGDILADSNFTKDGQLALGTNMRVAFMPYKGYTFEDGIVVSESAAKKLTSQHLYVEEFEKTEDHMLDKARFRSYVPRESTVDRMNKLDDEGVVKPGVVLEPGDIIIAALKRNTMTREELLKRELKRDLVKDWRNAAVVWREEVPGEVIDVLRAGSMIKVTIRTEEPAKDGDKIVGRHGNKGTIAKIIPDNEMPKTEDGEPIEVIINPHALPSRMNMGQVLETAASLIAEKTGKPFIVDNFSGEDYLGQIRKELKRLGIPEKQVIVDPKEGALENPVFVGKQYMLKLHHQTDRKFSARGIGGPGEYSYDEQPIRGGGRSGQAVDALTNYTLLAHGAKENLREMSVIKGQRNDEFWRAFQRGDTLPEPKVPFVFDKFMGYMQGLGLKVHDDQKLGQYQIMAMTDKDVEELSSGEIKDATLVMDAAELKEEKGGLLDPQVTGGLEGDKWAHITLAEPIPNPIFETPIKTLLDLEGNDYMAVLGGEKQLGGKTGGEAIRDALAKIDVDKSIAALREQLRTNPPKNPDKIHKKLRYLTALKNTGKKPQDYVMTKFPIIPPKFRPIHTLPDGTLATSDVNELYQHLTLANMSLKQDKDSFLLDDKGKGQVRAELYKAMQAVQGLADPITFDAKRRKRRGILREVGGHSQEGLQGKDAFFQSSVMRRRQDLSGRSVIAVGPDLDVDEIGLPEDMAWEIFKVHTVRELVKNTGMQPLTARSEVENRTPLAYRALQRVADTTPVILNRAPSLHKFSTMAFKPKLTKSKTIHLPSLLTGGFNADFDGDSMAVHVPVTEKAKQEALEKMLPSKNLFKPGHGDFMFTPGHEQVLGIYFLTKPADRNKPLQGKFRTNEEAERAYEKARREARGGVPKWKVDDPIEVGGRRVTIGQIMFNKVLPRKYQTYDKQFAKGDLSDLFKKMHKDGVAARTIVDVANKLKDLGNEYAYKRGFTVSLQDLDVDRKERDKIFQEAEKKLDKTVSKDDVRTLERIFGEATKKLETSLIEKNKDNAFVQMDQSKARGGTGNLRQILGAPGLLMDSKGQIVPTPVKRSYSEGLDTADYWVSMYGARKGMIDRAKSTQEPGALTKVLINNTLDHLITEKDCNTMNGLVKSIDDKYIHNRLLAEDLRGKDGKVLARRDTVVERPLVREWKSAGAKQAKVRSPLTCAAKSGLCAKCFGVMPDGRMPSVGENIGVIASHALTEPTTQLTMNSFHSGGIASNEEGKAEGFTRLKQILEMPKILPGAATLSEVNGRVNSITKTLSGGWEVTVNNRKHIVPSRSTVVVKVGDNVQKGDRLTEGSVDPKDLLRLRGLGAVRQYMTDEISQVYGNKIHHNAIETVVQKLTNLTKIIDPGNSMEFVEGQFAPLNRVEALNAQGANIKHEPQLKGINTLPLSEKEDWVAKMNFRNIRRNIIESASIGARSKYRGTENPITAFVRGVDFGKTPDRY